MHRKAILEVISKMQPVEAVALLESISKQLRRENSKKINEMQMGRMKVDSDRPDLQSMKP